MKRMFVLILISIVTKNILHAKENLSVGFAYDMDLGVSAQYNEKINAQIGNGGMCADYIFTKNDVLNNKKAVDDLDWYIALGLGYNWSEQKTNDGKIDIRVPVGIDYDFAKEWDFYFHLIPSLRADGDVRFMISSGFGVRYILKSN